MNRADMKRCPACEAVLPLDDFYRSSVSRDGRQGYCKPCSRAKKRAFYLANRDDICARRRALDPEYKREVNRKSRAKRREGEKRRVRTWEKENPEAVEAMIWRRTFRSRCAAYGLEPVVEMFRRPDVVERQGSESCAVCEATGDLVLDHVNPIAAGGSHTLDNVRLLCAPCNGWKVAEIDRPLIEAARAKVRRAELSTAA